jgi:DNA polymerase
MARGERATSSGGGEDEGQGEGEREELRRIAARLRTNLALRARSGLGGVPAGRTRRRAPIAVTPAPSLAAAPPVAPPPAAQAPARTPAHAAASAHALTPFDDAGDDDLDLPAGVPGAAGLKLVREELGDCTRCRLAKGRQNLVFGVGNPDAHLVFVGEAPGADEDAQGEPFVGKAGQLLTKMIEAMGYRREEVYICNVIKCRPPGNRNPEPDEVAACEPFLKKQLGAIRPRMIVTLGKFAVQCLLRDDTPITRLRGRFRSYEGIQLMPTFHPAYLLRDPSKKKEAWEDLKAVNAALLRMGFPPPHTPAG